MSIDMEAMLNHLKNYTSLLKSFASSPSKFQILHSLSASSKPLPPPKTLYILDSSFNPPTLAHLRIATSALLQDSRSRSSSFASPTGKRLLLLLATQNADKAPKPAGFEQRLCMIHILAQDLIASLPSEANPQSEEEGGLVGVDIGVIKLPYFVDKAAAIARSEVYGEPGEVEQVHMTGFDTLIRVLDPKYYGDKGLSVLDAFFERNRLRVTYRTDDEWGSRDEQDGYLAALGRGERGIEGAKGEWVRDGRIEMVEGRRDGEQIISSTRVRKVAGERDRDTLEKLVTKGVAGWILREGLYDGEDRSKGG
ncbi:cytidylyltransferase [Bisporella sp. PMI_857]|nr:cytidylyltransferase [Bisporella sp. PMI_857]